MACHQCQRPNSFLKQLGIEYILNLRSLCSCSVIHMHMGKSAAERPRLARTLLSIHFVSVLRFSARQTSISESRLTSSVSTSQRLHLCLYKHRTWELEFNLL